MFKVNNGVSLIRQRQQSLITEKIYARGKDGSGNLGIAQDDDDIRVATTS